MPDNVRDMGFMGKLLDNMDGQCHRDNTALATWAFAIEFSRPALPTECGANHVRFGFDNTYARLPEHFYSRVNPTPVTARAWSKSMQSWPSSSKVPTLHPTHRLGPVRSLPQPMGVVLVVGLKVLAALSASCMRNPCRRHPTAARNSCFHAWLHHAHLRGLAPPACTNPQA